MSGERTNKKGASEEQLGFNIIMGQFVPEEVERPAAESVDPLPVNPDDSYPSGESAVRSSYQPKVRTRVDIDG